MSDNWITKLARVVGFAARPAPTVQAPARGYVRQYAGARGGRLASGFGVSGNSSADGELASSLTQLRARSRQMVRDNPYAKRARTLIVNNVIGGGIGMQAQVMTTRGDLAQRVNDDIEYAWADWCEAERCHAGGKLHFSDLERTAMGEVFEAGEVLIRKHYVAFGDSRVPLGLELIEAERLASEYETVGSSLLANGNQVRMGVEVDRFGRPVAYYLRRRHPGDVRFAAMPQADEFERVLAGDMFHLHLVDRWPQSRGVPWLHTVLMKLDAMNEYSAAEVQAAKLSALHFGTIENVPDPDGPPKLATEGAGTGNGDQSAPPTYEVEAGMLHALEPGDKINWHAPNRPNTAIDPFLRYMLREVAAGVDISFASLSQNFSDSNYSSSRMSLLDDRDCWRVLQQWWIRSFRRPLHRLWLQQAVLANALPTVPVEQYGPQPSKFEVVLFKPRGWSWVDPTKEVTAYKEAIMGGLTTITDVISQTAGGLDIEDVIATRKREIQMLADAGIKVDTTVAEVAEAPPPAPPDDDEEDDDTEQEPPVRLFSFPR